MISLAQIIWNTHSGIGYVFSTGKEDHDQNTVDIELYVGGDSYTCKFFVDFNKQKIVNTDVRLLNSGSPFTQLPIYWFLDLTKKLRDVASSTSFTPNYSGKCSIYIWGKKTSHDNCYAFIHQSISGKEENIVEFQFKSENRKTVKIAHQLFGGSIGEALLSNINVAAIYNGKKAKIVKVGDGNLYGACYETISRIIKQKFCSVPDDLPDIEPLY